MPSMTRPDSCPRPTEGWAGPDDRDHMTYVMYDRASESAPHRDGWNAFFVAVHGANFTRWTYERMHPAAELTGGSIPEHVPGAYPNLSCCGGPVELVPA